jgi:asparagine synthase (glutamine-hydrolysing)
MVSPDSVAILDQLVWYFDEPFADSSAVPTYYVSHVAKQKVTVCLSGDGGDENFAGYRRYYFDRLENTIRSCIPTIIRQQCIKPLAGLYPKMDWAPQMFRAKTLLTNLAMDPVEGFFNSMSWFQGSRESLFTEDVTRQLAGYSPIDTFRRHYANAPQDPLSAVQYIDIKTYLVDDILTKVDRASMAHALEVRVPLLDHEFMELVANIPSSLKLKQREGKYILKKSLERKLPHDTLYRPKKGFSVPLGQWLKNDLKSLFEQSVLNRSVKTTQLLNKRTVETIWREHQSGQRERSAELWPILFFQKWLDKWL